MAEIKWVRNGPEAVLAAAAPSSPGLIRDLERRGEIQRSRGATRHCDQQRTTEAPVELHGPIVARSGSGSVSGRGGQHGLRESFPVQEKDRVPCTIVLDIARR